MKFIFIEIEWYIKYVYVYLVFFGVWCRVKEWFYGWKLILLYVLLDK